MEKRLYRSLYRIRRVEEEVARVYPSDIIKSPVHLAIGQEAVSVGVCDALHPEDIVFGTYRSHAYYLAKGGDLKAMIAELYGKSAGCCKGKGGSMHLADASKRIMGSSAVVATTIPNAVGYAWAMTYKRQPSVVVCFFGDGATEEGAFAESLNFAALKRVPLLFVCENNEFAIHSRQRERQATMDLVRKVTSYGVRAERLPDDVMQLQARTRQVIEAMRQGECGPHFFECMTCRWREHVGPGEDFNLGYRSREEVAPWIECDQVAALGRLLDESVRRRIEQDVDDEILAAFQWAAQCPWPDPSELLTEVYSGG